MRFVYSLSFLVLVLAVGVSFAAPLSYNGGVYSQDFNGLPTSGLVTIPGKGPHDIEGQLGATGLAGWTMSNAAGSSADTEFRAHDGSQSGNAGRGVVSFGTGTATERALGELPTSNQISRFGLSLVNNTGATVNQFTLSFTGEQWRRGDVTALIGAQNTLSFDYGVTSNVGDDINDDLLFTNIGSFASPTTTGTNTALDGNLPANQVPVTATVNNVNWSPGATLMVRWSGFDASGQDDALAIDSLSFRTVVPEPTSCVTLILAAAGAAGFRRRK